MVRPEDLQPDQLERLRDEMFGVFVAGWQGCLIYGCFNAGTPINMAAIIASMDMQEIEVSFDAWLQALVDEADVIGRTQSGKHGPNCLCTRCHLGLTEKEGQ